MSGVLDVSSSALVAQRNRLNIISNNLANQFSVFDAEGNHAPYRRKVPVFAPGDPSRGTDRGVHIREVIEDQSPFRKQFVGKGHPLADDKGYMKMPNIDPTVEMANAMEASRAYEANITAIEVTKSMMNAAANILA